jgi:methyl-accepting chemotaxis protein
MLKWYVNDAPVGRKIQLGFGLLAALVAGGAGFSVWTVEQTDAEVSLYRASAKSNVAAEQVVGEFTQMRVAARDYADALAAGDTARASKYMEELRHLRDEALERLTSLAMEVPDEALKSQVASLPEQIRLYESLTEDGSPEALLRRKELAESLTQDVSELSEVLTARRNEIGPVMQARLDLMTIVSISLLIMTLALGGTLGIVLSNMIGKPIRKTADSMAQLAAGDLTISTDGKERQDEVGALLRALEVFRANAEAKIRAEAEIVAERERAAIAQAEAEERQQQFVVDSIGKGLALLADGDLTVRVNQDMPPAYAALKSNFNTALTSLEEAMKSIVGTAGGIRSGAGEISQASDDLSRRTEQQAASLEETAAALDEITATVRKTADGSKQANAVVATTRADAETSGKVVQDTVAAMAEIEKSSKQISQIIGVIDEIAFQTNLLALNAGVEAARAGDAGRGFAVVASEVRSLAQRSSEAAKEIKGLISASSQHVETGVELVGEAGQALQKIVVKVNEISGLVSEIAASAQEQATALSEVNTAVNQMDQVTQQNAAMVEESTAASRSLTNEADELMTLIGRFQLGVPAALVGGSHNRGAAKAKPQAQPIQQQRQRVAQFASGGGGAAAAQKSDEDWQEF